MNTFLFILFNILSYLHLGTCSSLCACSSCCNVKDDSFAPMRGLSHRSIVFPTVSLDGTYTLINHTIDAATELNDYQFVFPWNDVDNNAFGRQIMFVQDLAQRTQSLNCSESHMYYSLAGGESIKIDFI